MERMIIYGLVLLNLCIGLLPVSYPHLDVYKRQSARSATMPSMSIVQKTMRT